MNAKRLMDRLTARQKDALLLALLKSIDQLDNDVDAGDKQGGVKRHLARESVAIQTAEQWAEEAGR